MIHRHKIPGEAASDSETRRPTSASRGTRGADAPLAPQVQRYAIKNIIKWTLKD